jgi:hypothetical protein
MPEFNTEYLQICAVPIDEECAQIGDSDYDKRSRLEAKAFVNQLTRVFGEPPEGAYIVPKSFPHDFGHYVEVCVVYDPSKQLSMDYAMNIENNIPSQWDSEALEELKDI